VTRPISIGEDCPSTGTNRDHFQQADFSVQISTKVISGAGLANMNTPGILLAIQASSEMSAVTLEAGNSAFLRNEECEGTSNSGSPPIFRECSLTAD
jgi:hypothetical protein